MNEIFSDVGNHDRKRLEARWIELTKVALPAIADARRWPVRFDHCFARILLDNACGGVWYEHVAKRPAYRHASIATLSGAVAMGEAALAGTVDLDLLNKRSLDWRRARRAHEQA